MLPTDKPLEEVHAPSLGTSDVEPASEVDPNDFVEQLASRFAVDRETAMAILQKSLVAYHLAGRVPRAR